MGFRLIILFIRAIQKVTSGELLTKQAMREKKLLCAKKR
jgi:hypothetical protein